MLYIVVYGTSTDVWTGNFDAWEDFAGKLRLAACHHPVTEEPDPLDLLLDLSDWIEGEDAQAIGDRLAAVAGSMSTNHRDAIAKARKACALASRTHRPLRVYA